MQPLRLLIAFPSVNSISVASCQFYWFLITYRLIRIYFAGNYFSDDVCLCVERVRSIYFLYCVAVEFELRIGILFYRFSNEIDCTMFCDGSTNSQLIERIYEVSWYLTKATVALNATAEFAALLSASVPATERIWAAYRLATQSYNYCN